MGLSSRLRAADYNECERSSLFFIINADFSAVGIFFLVVLVIGLFDSKGNRQSILCRQMFVE
jgi:Na+/pantothenate symporter